MTYLTWPEILRQFGLSAGFGPQLKKRTEDVYHDDNEVLTFESFQYTYDISLTATPSVPQYMGRREYIVGQSIYGPSYKKVYDPSDKKVYDPMEYGAVSM